MLCLRRSRKSKGQILFCYPNSDAGSRSLIRRAQEFLSRSVASGHIFTNLDALTYWSLLAQVELLLGNSSSGIMETASFALPTVNIGIRQKGRERAANVIDVEPTVESILAGIAQRAERRVSRVARGDDQSLWRWPCGGTNCRRACGRAAWREAADEEGD